jgi:hypothetical protein
MQHNSVKIALGNIFSTCRSAIEKYILDLIGILLLGFIDFSPFI